MAEEASVFGRLADDLLGHVLQQSTELSGLDIWAQACLVCRRWSRVARVTPMKHVSLRDPEDAGVQRVLEHVTAGAASVWIRAGKRITDAAIRSVVACCPGIVRLRLDGCNQVSNDAMQLLGSGCPGLTTLHLMNCRKVSDAGIQALCTSPIAGQLQELILVGLSDQVTDAALRAIASHMKELRHVDLSACKEIHDDGVGALVAGLPKLERLVLVYCDGLSNGAAMAIAAAHPPRLRALSLAFCGTINEHGATALIEGCPALCALALSGTYALKTNEALLGIISSPASLHAAYVAAQERIRAAASASEVVAAVARDGDDRGFDRDTHGDRQEDRQEGGSDGRDSPCEAERCPCP